MKFVDPRNDLAFKKIFGDKNKSDILISFLNAILDFKNDMRIVSLTLDNPYQMPDIEELKETILDIKERTRQEAIRKQEQKVKTNPIAQKMIARGDSNDDIAEITELSIREIEKLRNS